MNLEVLRSYLARTRVTEDPITPLADGDARIDTAKLFYQGPELNAPLGIAVLGKRVIVAQSPYVWNFYDDNGDDKADRKEIMFQGIEGEQHDHGMHTFTFGADGKLYFNFGNNGKTLNLFLCLHKHVHHIQQNRAIMCASSTIQPV